MSDDVEDSGAVGQDAEEVRVATVGPEAGTLDFGEKDALVDGDVLAGAVIRGEGHLRVTGSVIGEEGREAVLDLAETLVVEGSVTGAQLRGRHIVVARDVARCDIRSDLGVEIRGSLSTTTVSLGHRTAEIESLRRHRKSLMAVQKDLATLDVRIGSNARRFKRDYPQVDLSLGRILRSTDRQIEIDLQPFYDAAGEENEAALQRSLEAFYLKVVVGTVTRANSHYVKQNPSRQKIFLKVIEELREHLLIVFRGDMLRRETDALMADRNGMLRRLGQPLPLNLRVRGTVGEDVRVRALAISNLREDAKGVIAMDEAWAETKMAREKGGLVLETSNLAGRKAIVPAPQDPLSHGQFVLEADRVVWTPTS